MLLRRALANHTHQDSYLLALLHHHGDRHYDLDGQPVGTVTEAERPEAARLLEASTQRGQPKPSRSAPTRPARRNTASNGPRNNGTARKKPAARPSTSAREQEIAARKAALIAQGLMPESRAERKRRLAQASRTGFRPPAVPKPGLRPPAGRPGPAARATAGARRPRPGPASRAPAPPGSADPAPAPSMPPIEFRKKRRTVPPDEKGPS